MVAAVLLVSLLLVAAGIVFALQPFPNVYFGFGTLTVVEGVSDGPAVGGVWLAGQGKRGYVLPPGRRMRVTGSPIERDGVRMLEVASAEDLGPASPLASEDLGTRAVTGEIVDTKCYLGVMNPGTGTVHKDCAAHCLRGGIPAGIVSGGTLYVIQGAVAPRLAGTRVTLSGRVIRKAGRLILRLE
jgi:hypothetical protein